MEEDEKGDAEGERERGGIEREGGRDQAGNELRTEPMEVDSRTIR